MTPTEIETAARRAYNAVGDTFWSQDELLCLMYQAQMLLVDMGLVIERIFSSSTVASQREYDYPTNLIALKRIEYDGAKLAPIDFREDDALTLDNAATTDSGTPQYYSIWNETLFLRPIPDAVGTLKIFGYVEPQALSITSNLEVPSKFHPAIVDYLLREMVIKDSNFTAYDRYNARWDRHLVDARKWSARKKRTDGNAVVKNEDILSVTLLGRV
jgi:hypothetical protein